jgi:hypothetical protein
VLENLGLAELLDEYGLHLRHLASRNPFSVCSTGRRACR